MKTSPKRGFSPPKFPTKKSWRIFASKFLLNTTKMISRWFLLPKRHFSWPSFWDHQRTCCDKKFRSKASRNVKFLGNRTPQEGSQSINGDLPINLESTKLVEFVLMIQKCESHVSKNQQHVIGPTKLEHSDTKSYTNLQLT